MGIAHGYDFTMVSIYLCVYLLCALLTEDECRICCIDATHLIVVGVLLLLLYNLYMQTPLDIARTYLEEGLRKCIRGKLLVPNGNRSGVVMNILHEAIYHAYAALLDGHSMKDTLDLCGEHEGKIGLPYEDGVKNLDLALKLRNTGTFLDAIFVKAPINNYGQNRKNYEESMAGTFLKCRNAHRHLRVVFFDFLPNEDIYFDNTGSCKGWTNLKTPSLPSMNESHPAFYAHARYSYHPDLEKATSKQEFASMWEALEAVGQEPLQNINVHDILVVLSALVDDLAVATAEAQVAMQKDASALLKGLALFDTRSPYGNDDKVLGKSLGLIYAALGGYGMRQRMYLYKRCVQRWVAQQRLDTPQAWALLDQELTNF